MIISLTPDYTPGYTSHYTPGLMKDAYDGQETGAMTGCNGTMPTGPYICCGKDVFTLVEILNSKLLQKA